MPSSLRLFSARSLTLLLGASLAGFVLFAPAGCFLYKDDPLYCADADLHTCDIVTACQEDLDCASPDGVCDLDRGVCVSCTPTSKNACTDKSPVCGADYECRACSSHAECGSNACLPDGSCGDDSNVAYVSATDGIDNDQCSKAMPCKTVGKGLTITPLRSYVKLSGELGESVTLSGGRKVAFLADPGAKLSGGATNAPIITVQDDLTALEVYDLAITNAFNDSNGYGIRVASGGPKISLTRTTISNNPAGAISMTGGSLFLSRSIIFNNQGGGIFISNGTFDIVNNFVFRNGAVGGTTGGISISTTENTANRLENNSFTSNQAQNSVGQAIHCLAGNFTARNNIMFNNGTLTENAQAGGGCKHAYSIASPGTLTGTGNLAVDPMFKNASMGDLHISATSPARGMADPASNPTGPLAQDIDGQPRATPADIGADEVP